MARPIPPALRFAVFLTAIASCATSMDAADIPRPTGSKKIVSPDAKLELLFTRQIKAVGGLTEGAAVARDGSIYFSDITRGETPGMIHRFDPITKKTSVFSNNSGKSNGLIFDDRGFLYACEGAGYGGRRVARWNVRTKEKTTVVDGIGGKRFNSPNDICIDSKGRLYFTDPRYVGHEPRELKHRAVYRTNRKGDVVEVTHQVSKPNGVALSPREDWLYVADHDNGTDNIDPDAPAPTPGDMKIYAFPLSKGLVAGERKTLYDFGSEKGCDGMTVDRQGNVYLTVRSPQRPGVLVLDPGGKEIAHIPTGPQKQKTDAKNPPVGLPSNVEFGLGREGSVLYITVDTSLYRIRLNAQGYHRQYAEPLE
ncbi:MAG: SMP-30/gluconolactonase/LRE family protein [Pirellulaceae bacterium]|jgi:gluconolactonase|nr:SMP-30/gluconolactonase/LRE family protein [Pirellulaceae bacterium]MDP7015560.1 SMP-30/gluconolactonase/LRE family protein [Pirellulaceae bacterium]